jgi:hypothetical protein
MKTWIRTLIAAVIALAVLAPVASAGGKGDGWSAPSSTGPTAPTSTARPPVVSPGYATKVTSTSATLIAAIDPNASKGRSARVVMRGPDKVKPSFHFDYGTGTAYGLATPTATIDGNGDDWTMVSAKLAGLTPGTTYHFRAVASNGTSSASGGDATFKTQGTAPAGGASTGASASPTLGQTLVAAAATGTVLFKPQDSTEFQPLDGSAEIPVDSTIDATNGSVVLETAIAGGDSQKGTFKGGTFQVHQPRQAGGMTTIALRGGDFSSCNGAPAGRLSRGSSAGRHLWAHDDGGKFKTSAKGSVATVRGTTWYTADTCEGTVTHVLHGKVMVRERGTGRQRLLSSGQSFLAHYPH